MEDEQANQVDREQAENDRWDAQFCSSCFLECATTTQRLGIRIVESECASVMSASNLGIIPVHLPQTHGRCLTEGRMVPFPLRLPECDKQLGVLLLDAHDAHHLQRIRHD